MFKIRDHLSADNMQLDLKGRNKREIIDELLSLIKSEELDREECLDALLCRESLGSTGIGSGVALPHAKVASASRIYIAVGLHKKGVDFDSIDFDFSRLFFLILAPLRREDAHLSLISKIAKIARNGSLIKEILKSQSPEDLIKILEPNL